MSDTMACTSQLVCEWNFHKGQRELIDTVINQSLTRTRLS